MRGGGYRRICGPVTQVVVTGSSTPPTHKLKTQFYALGHNRVLWRTRLGLFRCSARLGLTSTAGGLIIYVGQISMNVVVSYRSVAERFLSKQKKESFKEQ